MPFKTKNRKKEINLKEKTPKMPSPKREGIQNIK
jgi:hypothetical protein